MFRNTRPNRILAIDWDARTIRVVDARVKKHSFAVESFVTGAVPPEVDAGNPEQMGACIRRLLDQCGMNTRSAVVDIPRDQAILNTLKLPVTAPDELPSIVQIQVAKELPFPVSEAVVDYAVPRTAPGQTVADVLVAAVRKEVVEQYVKTCAAAGLKLDRIGLRPYANMAAIRRLFDENPPERVVFVDVGPVLTEIDVLRDGQLAFSRAASVHIPTSFEEARPKLSLITEIEGGPGAEERVEARTPVFGVDAVVNSLMMELTRSLEAYRAHDHGATIDRVIVGGAMGCERDFVDAIRGRLRIEAEAYNPATLLPASEEGEAAASFASTLGLVIGCTVEGDRHFDFLHPKQTVTQVQRKLKRAPMAAAVAVLFLAAAVVGAEQMTRGDRQVRARLQEDIKKLKKHEDENKEFLKVVENVRAFDKDQYVWIDALHDLVTALPDNRTMILDEIVFDQGKKSEQNGTVVLKTRTKDPLTANEAVETLNKMRREGSDKPLFKASVHTSSAADDRENYKYRQDLLVQILKAGKGTK